MPSELYTNDKVSFVVAREFSSNGKDYHIGDDFPQEDTNKLEVMVRARYIIAVVEDENDKPRRFHREIRPRQEVLDRLSRSLVQIVMPSVDAEALAEAAAEQVKEGASEQAEFDPSEHTVVEVKAHLEDHPEDAERVLAAEAEDRGRKSLVEE